MIAPRHNYRNTGHVRAFGTLAIGAWALVSAGWLADRVAAEEQALPELIQVTRLSDQVEQLRLAQGVHFVTPSLVAVRSVPEGAWREYVVLDGRKAGKRIPIEGRQLIAGEYQVGGSAKRFALVGPAEAQKVRIEIYNARGEAEKTYLAPAPASERYYMEPLLLMGDKVVVVPAALHEPLRPYDVTVLSPDEAPVLLKAPNRIIFDIQLCGNRDMLVSGNDREPLRHFAEVIDLKGKVRWSQDFAADTMPDLHASPDGNYLVISYPVNRRQGGFFDLRRDLLELATGKRAALPAMPAGIRFLPDQSCVALIAKSRVCCVGLDGTPRLDQETTLRIDAIALVHLGSGAALACVGLDNASAAYEVHLFSFPQGCLLEKIVLARNPEEAKLLQYRVNSFVETARGNSVSPSLNASSL